MPEIGKCGEPLIEVYFGFKIVVWSISVEIKKKMLKGSKKKF